MTDEGMTLWEMTKENLMIENMKEYLLGKCKYHETNVKIYFLSPVGIGEHPDVLGAIEMELAKARRVSKKN